MKLLGVPIHPSGDFGFVQDCLDSCIAKQQAALGKVVMLPDAQIQHALVRQCLDACKLQWLLRTSPTLMFPDTLRTGDHALRGAMNKILGHPLDDSHWHQPCLPIRDGGLGIRCPSTVAPSARIAAIQNWWARAGTDLGLKNVEQFHFEDEQPLITALHAQLGGDLDPLRSWIADGVLSPSVGDACSQRWWSSQVMAQKRVLLVSKASGRDAVRLHHQAGPMATAWMTGLGLRTAFYSTLF